MQVGVRAIADRAGVTTPTLYRHFPRRSDLVAAAFAREIDACVLDASSLALARDPDAALELWIERYATLLATKPGLAMALHLGDPALERLPEHFERELGPALAALLAAAVDSGTIRDGVDPLDLLAAVAKLSIPPTAPTIHPVVGA